MDEVCNLCGGSLCPPHAQEPYGLVDAVVTGGYESDGLVDLTRYRFSLCERCLRTLFTRCVVPPRVADVLWGGYGEKAITFAEDQRTWELQEFRRDGSHAATFRQGLCNAVKGCGCTATWAVLLSGEPTEDLACDEHKTQWANTLNATFAPFRTPAPTESP